MPVTIHELESEIDVRPADEDGSGPDVAARTQPTPAAQESWRESARREHQQLARTAAWGHDD